jgi:DNA polymerase III epsilon subunit-like protein
MNIKGTFKLQSLAQRFNIEVKAAHRADDDARVCMEVLKRIVEDSLPRQKDYKQAQEEKSQLSLF